MVTLEAQQPGLSFLVRPRRIVQADEVVVFCPACKTLETLQYSDGSLVKTRKFTQQDREIFHDCGSVKPCRLYRPI